MDNKTLIEIDANDLATPKIAKLQGKMKDTAKSTGLLSTAFGDLASKAESMGVPVSNIQKYIGALGAGGIAAGAVAGIGAVAVSLGAATVAAMNFGSELNDLSLKTGISVENLSSMRNVLATNGLTLDDYANAVSKLSVKIGENGNKFKKLGIDISSPEAAFESAKLKIGAIQDPIEKAALANQLFGKSFKELLPLLNMTNEEYSTMKGNTTVFSSEFANNADRVGDKLDILKTTFGDFAVSIGTNFLPLMENVIGLFQDAAEFWSKKNPDSYGTKGIEVKLDNSDKMVELNTYSMKSKDAQAKLAAMSSSELMELSTWASTEKKNAKLSYEILQIRKEVLRKEESAAKQSKKSGYAPPSDKTSEQIKQEQEAARRASIQKIIDAENAKIRNAEFDAMVSSRFSNLPGYDQKLNIDTLGSKDSTLKAKMAYNAATESKFESIQAQTVYDMTPEETAQWISDNSAARKEAIDKAREEEQTAEKEASDKHNKEIAAIWQATASTLQSTMTAPFEGLFRAMARGKADFKDFARSMVDAFGDMLIQMAARLAAYSAVFAILAPFTGGAMGKFSLLKGLGFAANGSEYLPAGYTLVGERGPEIIYNDKPGAKVISNSDMNKLGNKQMNIVNNFNVREVKAKDVVDGIDAYNRKYARYGITAGA